MNPSIKENADRIKELRKIKHPSLNVKFEIGERVALKKLKGLKDWEFERESCNIGFRRRVE